MSTIDVRNENVKIKVCEILFAESKADRGTNFAYAVGRPNPDKRYPFIVDGCNEFVYIRTEADADNLIKALEVAKKEGFWNDRH